MSGDREISKNALALMDDEGISQADIPGVGKITLTHVRAYLLEQEETVNTPVEQLKYGALNDSNPIFAVPERRRKFELVGPNMTGLEPHEVFLPENQLEPGGVVKFAGQPMEGYLNMPCRSYPVMEQLGRGIWHYRFGQWTLVTEFDGTPFPTNHWAVERQLTDKPFRLIRARVEQYMELKPVKVADTTQPLGYRIEQQEIPRVDTHVDEWSLKNLEWFRHSIMARLVNNVVSWKKKLNLTGYDVALSKYHWLGILKSIDIGRPLGREMKVCKGVCLVGSPKEVRIARKAMIGGYLSESWQGIGARYQEFYNAKQHFSDLQGAPINPNGLAEYAHEAGL